MNTKHTEAECKRRGKEVKRLKAEIEKTKQALWIHTNNAQDIADWTCGEPRARHHCQETLERVHDIMEGKGK